MNVSAQTERLPQDESDAAEPGDEGHDSGHKLSKPVHHRLRGVPRRARLVAHLWYMDIVGQAGRYVCGAR